MKRLALLVGLLALGVSGCSGQGASPEDAYLAEVHEVTDLAEGWDLVPDSTLIELGQSACEAGIRDDAEIADMAAEAGAPIGIALAVNRAAHEHLCPEEGR